jgi:hypothetical protein
VSDSWPASERGRRELPRLEDLPGGETGYDRAAVGEAFDAFYRHAAQLDTTLRSLAAVDAFRRDADALRLELQAVRPTTFEDAGRSSSPLVVLRLAAEAALLIAVAVVAGVARFRSVTVVELMAAAFVVVALCEWLAARSAFVPPVFGFAQARPALPDLPPSPALPHDADPWEEAPAEV